MTINDIYQLFMIIICISILIVGILLLSGAIQLCEELKKKRELRELEINLSYRTDESDIAVIDTLIKDNIQEYQILYLEHQNDLYITQKIQSEMEVYILKGVLTSISPMIHQKLKYIYNEELMEDIILKKIRFAIMDYSIEVNSNLQ